MANRTFNQYQHSLEKKPVHLWAEVTFSTGTPTLVSGKCKGFSAVAKSATGHYKFTFTDAYRRVLAADWKFITNSASTGPTSGAASWIKARSSTTLEIVFGTDRTTAADPGDGDTLLLHVSLSDSSAY